MRKKILVVDDEEDICEILRYNLVKEGFSVDTACSAEEALTMEVWTYDLFLLDVMMGEMSGFDLARRLKENPETSSAPVIFLTAKDTEDDTVAGLDLGADDYISKPFSIREVISRINAVLRRVPSSRPSRSVSFQSLEMNVESKTVTADGEDVPLTKTEFEILHLLLSRPGKVFSREEIISAVWPDETVVVDRTIDVNITRLRHKIGRYGEYIVTRHGYGYCFDPER